MGVPVKILFLDVDGVINIPPYNVFDTGCLDNLECIINKTSCNVVISSSWRTGDLKLTKKHFPIWLQKYIVGETVRGYDYTIKGSSIPIQRGNEIKHWVDRNLVYPWHEDESKTGEYKVFNEDGSFKMMRSNKNNIDFTYVIIDDDDDMLYCQKDNFVQTVSKYGLTYAKTLECIQILNRI